MPRLTPDQIAERRTGLGSSDIVAIAGLSPHRERNATSVWASKLGLVEEHQPGDEAEVGHELEPWMLAWYTRVTGSPLSLGQTVRHKVHPWAFATIDGRAAPTFATTPPTKSRIVEVKIVGARMSFDWDDTCDDGVPDYTRAQTDWQLGCVDEDEQADVAALLGGTNRKIFRLNRDTEREGLLFEIGAKFWRDFVEGNKQPPPDHTDICREVIAARFPREASETWLMANGDVEELARLRIAAALRAKGGEQERKRLDAELMLQVGEDFSGITGSNWKFSWKVGKGGVRRTRFTVQGKEACDDE